ncbi:MAG: hypothetical protein IPJ03_19400 [Ignavibacteriales bacterium]|nr:hypothetical protein [Ignavibacteriales bacterium]
MKYLKFLTQREILPLGDYFQMNFTLLVKDTPKTIDKNVDIKSIEVRLTGREDGSLRAQHNNYELESALFTIAKNYITEKIESRQKIQDSEKIYPDASEYLYLDSEPLEVFNKEIIEVEEK